MLRSHRAGALTNSQSTSRSKPALIASTEMALALTTLLTPLLTILLAQNAALAQFAEDGSR